MIKNGIRSVAQKFGYDFAKTNHYKYGERFKKISDDPDFYYYETPTGNYYFPKTCTGDGIANKMKEGKLFDQAIIDIAKNYIRPKTSILDIGANYGQMSIEFSRMAPSCKIYSFEAQELVYQVLEKNIRANKANNIVSFYNAVYDNTGLELIFPVPDLVRFPTYGSYGLDLHAKEGKVVKSVAIDSLAFDLPISFMKIDIQGSDLAAMKGAVNTIKKHQMPIIFEYEEQFQTEFETSFQDYVDFVDSIGYKFIKTIQDINYLIAPKQKLK